MNLLKQVNSVVAVKEDDGGAVGAGSVAGASLPLFASLVKRSKVKKQPIAEPKKKTGLRLGETFHRLSEDLTAGGDDEAASKQAAIDTEETIARLKSLETRDSADKRDVVVFGLEDDNGGIVRVSIKPDQAEEFEQALQNFINDREQEDDSPEIAELLFSMRDHFDIIDVDWPEVEEDEEQVSDIDGEMPPEGEMDPNAEMPIDGPPVEDTSQVTTLLTQVIDMMKADAAARHADAKAREAEAKTREAASIHQQASARVKQEEQFLDMEQAQKASKEEQKETKRLAQLAKWKRDVGQDTGVGDFDDELEGGIDGQLPPDVAPQPQGQEEEEIHRTRPQGMPTQKVPVRVAGKPRAAPRDIASFILKRIQ